MTGCPLAVISSTKWVGVAPFAAHLSGARSSARLGRTIGTYEWDFGDGSTGTGAEVDHTYADPGVYTVKLSVGDSADSFSSEAERQVVVTAGGIIIQGDAFDDVALGGTMEVRTTGDGVKTLYSPVGSATTTAELGIVVTALPAGEESFPVGVLIRNVGDHYGSFSLAQRTTGVTSTLMFLTNSWDGDTAGFVSNVDARDNALNMETAINDTVGRTQDPAVEDAYTPLTYAVTGSATATPGPATFKLVDGLNRVRFDCPLLPADLPANAGTQGTGVQVAAIVIGGDFPDLAGEIVSCPSTPIGLKGTGGPCQVSLDWNDAGGVVTGYNVFRSPTNTGTYEKIATTTTSDYLDIGLTKSTSYYYKVTAFSAECESLISTQALGRTPATACVEAPTNLVVTDKVGKVALSWTKVGDPTVTDTECTGS